MKLLEDVKRVLNLKMHGDKWCTEALPTLVEIAIKVKDTEAKKTDLYAPIQKSIDQANIVYKDALDAISEMDNDTKKLKKEDAKLRERVLSEHEGHESLTVDGVGELVFAAGSWEIEVTDMKKVDPKYITIDRKAVETDAKNGIVNFKGLKVTRGRSLRVMTK